MKRFTTIFLLSMLIVCLSPVTAQDLPFQSTSSMGSSGSAYSSQVTSVGATGVAEMATTTGSFSPAKAPRRTESQSGRDAGDATTGTTVSPVGDALFPLLGMALAFAGVVALRRRQRHRMTA